MASQLLKLDEPKIDPTNPWADDDFDRREHGERLARLVRTMPGPFVLALKAPWGAGKTVFLERWAHHLENDPNYPVPVVRLDLWENDYLDDPMDAFVVSLSDRLLKASAKEKNKTKLKALASAVAETGPKLVPFVARVVAAVSTGGTTELVITAADLFKEAGANLLGKSKEHKTSVLDFREQLKKAREALAKAQTDSTVPRSPLVFLVDELDRCRPDFSIRALERIKHFFNVPGIVFVIATDGDNLPSAVQCLYGPSVEGERYLRKFFDFEFRLPDPTSEQVALSFFRKFGLLASFESSGGHVNFDENRKRWRENKEPSSHHSGDAFLLRDCVEMIESFITFSACMSLTLRDRVQALTILVAVIRSADRSTPTLPAVLVFVICLRFCAPSEYDLICSGRGALSFFLKRDTPQVFSVPGNLNKVGVSSLLGQSGGVYECLKLYASLGDMSLEDRNAWRNNVQQASTRNKDLYIQSTRLYWWQSEQIPTSFDAHMPGLMNIVGTSGPARDR